MYTHLLSANAPDDATHATHVLVQDLPFQAFLACLLT